ncbi:probable polygalacturonase At1g80170 isoform X2 [Punica granatum]|uniref:endo-polygalacturonase n=1 Tax=Punica granatum TaxID=22663 RepID=A0A6P8BTV3_PUNGR|nr:probable polygalacturonase At1g80170 isoform X2 [Punica granatum]
MPAFLPSSLFRRHNMRSHRSSHPHSATHFILYTLVLFSSSSGTVLARKVDPLIQLPRTLPSRNRHVSKRVLLVDDHGARGDGFSDDTDAFKKVWKKACSLRAPSRIKIPDGKTYLVGPIDLSGPCRSKVTLQISGSIVAPEDPQLWDGLNPHKWLYFHGVNHLTLEGRGRINGMGRKWWAQSCKTNSTNPCQPAPTAITFHRCKNLRIQYLTVIDSPKMHIAFTNCLQVKASNLTVIAPRASPNTDGVHISASRAIEVENTMIRTGDDCISIVSNSSGVTIKNIICGPGHGISIGSLGKWNSLSEIRNVIVDGAILSNTDNGVRIKTWQGGSGFASDIVFQNVWMENVSNPIIIDQYYCDSFLPCRNQTESVKVKNIVFMHIKGTSATEAAITFACSDESPCEGLYLEDIELVSHAGGLTRALCWQAYGDTLGVVYPPVPCFSDANDNSFMEQKGDSRISAPSFR